MTADIRDIGSNLAGVASSCQQLAATLEQYAGQVEKTQQAIRQLCDQVGSIGGIVGTFFEFLHGHGEDELHKIADDQTVVFTAGGVGLPPVYPIARANLQLGNHVTLIAGFRSADLLFWVAEEERVEALRREFGDLLDVVYTSNDGSFGREGFVTVPLEELLDASRAGTAARSVAEVVAIGPPLMMRAVADLSRGYGVKTVASLNSIMVDATGMCGACMVPVNIDGKLIRKHACIDGPEIDAHIIDWDKFLPRFNQFKRQEAESRSRHNVD